MKSYLWLGVLVVLAGCEAGPGPNVVQAEEPMPPHSIEEVDDAPKPKWVLLKWEKADGYDVAWSEKYVWRGQQFNSYVSCYIGCDKEMATKYARRLNELGLGENWTADVSEESQEQVRKYLDGELKEKPELESDEVYATVLGSVATNIGVIEGVGVSPAGSLDVFAGDMTFDNTAGTIATITSSGLSVDAFDCGSDCGKCMGCAERAEDAALQKRIEDAARKIAREEIEAATAVEELYIDSDGRAFRHRTKDGHLTVAGLIAELEKVEDKSKSACDSVAIIEDIRFADEVQRVKVRGNWLGLESISEGTGGPGGLQFSFTYTDTPAKSSGIDISSTKDKMP